MDAQLLADCLADLDRGLLQRDVAVRAALLGALAGEHVLLVGPPGTAKSELARRLHHLFAGARYFERLLTRFSVPEELFGPLSLKALEDDRYERLIGGFLPTAHVAFLDEVFKANSAILNALLTLLNEREFDNGDHRLTVPLIALIGATNEVPSDEALHAFFDRFLLRVPVEPVDDAHFAALLALPASSPAPAPRLSQGDVTRLAAQAAGVRLPPAVVERLAALRAECARREIAVSDRRWRKLVALLQVQAASRGADAIDAWDLWVVPYVLADSPGQSAGFVDWFRVQVGRAQPLDLQGFERAVQAFEKQLELEWSAPASADDDGAGKLALARSIGGGTAQGSELVRLVADGARKRYSPLHVQARSAQVDELLARLESAAEQVRADSRPALAAAAAHPWLPPSWRAQIEAVHADNDARLAELLHRARLTREGFAALPVDAALPATAPEPVALPD